MEQWAERLDTTKRTVLVTVGFSCLYAVAIVFFYYDWLFDLSFSVNTFLYALLLNGSLCIGALVVFFSAKRVGSDRIFIFLGCICYAFALFSMCVSLLQPEVIWVYGAGVFAGLGAGLLVPIWFDRIGMLPGNLFAVSLGVSSLIGALLALAIDVLSLLGNIVVCGVLLAASIVLLILLDFPFREKDKADSIGPSQKDDDFEIEEPVILLGKNQGEEGVPAFHARLLLPLAYVALLSVIYGVLDTVAMASSISASWSGFVSQLGGLATNVAFILYARHSRRRYSMLLNVVLAVIATGLLFLPFLGEGYRVVLVVLTHMGWEMALLISYALVIDVLRENRRLLIGWAALVFAVPRPGVVAGTGLAELVARGGGYEFAQITIVAFALLYLIMTGILLLRTSEKRAANHAIRRKDELIKRYARAKDDIYALACEDIALSKGLTKRETELLRLLSQGRDAAYVEKELFLSRNTVKSYTKSVYAKLGVHSKQELIDLVKMNLPTI